MDSAGAIVGLVIGVITIAFGIYTTYTAPSVNTASSDAADQARSDAKKALAETRARQPEIDAMIAWQKNLLRDRFPDLAQEVLPEDATLEGIAKRMQAIESRLPLPAMLDKIASVNDAILATKLEGVEKEIAHLQESIDRTERLVESQAREIPSSGKVYGMVLTCIGVVVGASAVPFVVVDYLSKR